MLTGDDADISRAIEASLKDGPSGTFGSYDPFNPE